MGSEKEQKKNADKKEKFQAFLLALRNQKYLFEADGRLFQTSSVLMIVERYSLLYKSSAAVAAGGGRQGGSIVGCLVEDVYLYLCLRTESAVLAKGKGK